jgi:hypothetical protein
LYPEGGFSRTGARLLFIRDLLEAAPLGFWKEIAAADRSSPGSVHPRSVEDEPGYGVYMVALKSYSWKAITLGSGALSGLISQRVVERVWRSVRASTPPPAPADRTARWTDALSWAIATGVGAGVARLVAVRTAARMWQATTHEVPPDPALQS